VQAYSRSAKGMLALVIVAIVAINIVVLAAGVLYR